MLCIGLEQGAVQPATFLMFVGRQQQIEAKGHQQQQQLLSGDTDGRESFDQALAGPEQDL